MYEVNYKLKHGINNSYNDFASVNLVEKTVSNNSYTMIQTLFPIAQVYGRYKLHVHDEQFPYS